MSRSELTRLAPMGRDRLGQLVKRRRESLGLSVKAAAEAAEINRATWDGVEKSNRNTLSFNYGPMERILGWAPGSMETVLAGGEPAALDDGARTAERAEPEATEPPLPDDEAIIKVMRSTRIPEDQKKKIVQILIEDREREQRRRVALAEGLIQTWSEAG